MKLTSIQVSYLSEAVWILGVKEHVHFDLCTFKMVDICLYFGSEHTVK